MLYLGEAAHRALLVKAGALTDANANQAAAAVYPGDAWYELPQGDDEKLLYIELSAVATEAIAEILESDVAAEKVLGRHLRRLGRRINNEQRATLARRVLGVSVLRKRLAYIADRPSTPNRTRTSLYAPRRRAT